MPLVNRATTILTCTFHEQIFVEPTYNRSLLHLWPPTWTGTWKLLELAIPFTLAFHQIDKCSDILTVTIGLYRDIFIPVGVYIGAIQVPRGSPLSWKPGIRQLPNFSHHSTGGLPLIRMWTGLITYTKIRKCLSISTSRNIQSVRCYH